MIDAILTLNAGSSTLKFALFKTDTTGSLLRLYSGLIEHGTNPVTLRLQNVEGEVIYDQQLKQTQAPAVEHVLNCIKAALPSIKLKAISHRLVHGGQQFFDATVVDAKVLEQLKTLIPLAPLHLPEEIHAIDTLLQCLPDVPQVAYFDTAFHRNQLTLSKMLPLPRSFFDEGIIRYGFHGLSYEYIASQLNASHGLTIVAHLGSGASVCVLKNRQSVTHSMGFSTNEGLMMSTRCGSIDPGVILYLLEEKNYSVAEVHSLLFDQSGLLGVSGISADIRQLEKSDKPEAQQAIDFFCYRTAAEIGKLLPALGGIDTVVFTAGIGEHSAIVRQKICAYLQWLGLRIDNDANQDHLNIISSKDSAIKVMVIPTDEEFILAKKACDIMLRIYNR